MWGFRLLSHISGGLAFVSLLLLLISIPPQAAMGDTGDPPPGIGPPCSTCSNGCVALVAPNCRSSSGKCLAQTGCYVCLCGDGSYSQNAPPGTPCDCY